MPDYMYGDDPIEINAGRSIVTMTVRNTGDRAVQVGSHYHFFEANRALSFDRERAYGRHLDIPAGTAVRFEAGDAHEVDLVEYGGGLRIVGFAGLVNGGIRSERTHRDALARMAEQGFENVSDESVTERPAARARRPVLAGTRRAAEKKPAEKKPAAKKPAAKKPAAKKAAPKTAPQTAKKATARRAAPAAKKAAPARSRTTKRGRA